MLNICFSFLRVPEIETPKEFALKQRGLSLGPLFRSRGFRTLRRKLALQKYNSKFLITMSYGIKYVHNVSMFITRTYTSALRCATVLSRCNICLPGDMKT